MSLIRMSSHAFSTTALLALSVGCSSTAPEPPASDRPEGVASARQATVAAATTATGLPGFSHSAAKSKFALGATQYSRSEAGLTRVVGAFGAFAIHPSTGMFTAMSNANSPARARPPLTSDVQAHNDAVRAYFVAAGLPVAQIDAVREQVVMAGGGRDLGDEPSAGGAKLDGVFSTVFRRSPGGVPILDSYAWARMNVDGDVTMESVYWPKLPDSVVAEADAFRSMLGDATARAQFLARLAQRPKEIREDYSRGELKIHHSPGTWTGPFEARATYDIADGNRIVHFDVSGQRVHLAHESAAPAGATVKP